MRARFPLVFVVIGALCTACPSIPEAQCAVGLSDFSPYLVQLRPQSGLPAECPQGQQYQLLTSSNYSRVGSTDPIAVAFQLLGSTVKPPSGAQARGTFNSALAPSSGVCAIDALTPATDDRATPTNAPIPVGATTYTFSRMQLLSDVGHQGSQFQAEVVVDYGISGCSAVKYVAQAVTPITPCLNDSICLPDQVATDVLPPAGRGLGSGLSSDYRAFCNLAPALLDNLEVSSVLGRFPYVLAVGRDAYEDPNNRTLHDVGICFFSEPFPSLCPPGSTLSTSGPCIVGPGSNPH